MQPYPSAGQVPEPPQAPRIAPRPVLNAVKLMWAGAFVEAVTLVIGLATISSTKVAIHKDNPKLTSQQIATSVNVDLAYVALSIVLWIVISLACRRGMSWARMTGTVLFGLNTLTILLAVSRFSAGIGILINLLVWLVGLGAVILLWRRESSAFFRPPPPA
jgi:hypothetical protein